jgi:hypothetical protein
MHFMIGGRTAQEKLKIATSGVTKADAGARIVTPTITFLER